MPVAELYRNTKDKTQALMQLSVAILSFFLGACYTLTYPESIHYRGFQEAPFRGTVEKLPFDLAKEREVWLGPRQLPNGHIENHYGSDKKCIYIFEVDPERRRMVGWRFKYKHRQEDCLPQDRGHGGVTSNE